MKRDWKTDVKRKLYIGKNLEYSEVRVRSKWGFGFGFRLFKRRFVFAIIGEWK